MNARTSTPQLVRTSERGRLQVNTGSLAALLVSAAMALGCREEASTSVNTQASAPPERASGQAAALQQAAAFPQTEGPVAHVHPPKHDLAAFVAEVGLPEDITKRAWRVLENTGTLADLIEQTTPIGTVQKVKLGRKLFFEPRLSKSGKIACASCHDLQRYGVDGRPTAVGHNAQQGPRNTPTVLNAAGSSLFFWDGRATTLEVQAREPLLNPIEMALEDEQQAVRKLGALPTYAAAFKEAFPQDQDSLSFANILAALSAYERTLVTPAPWDEYVEGREDAVSANAKRGFVLFQHHGCANCHRGETVGGNSLWTLGMREPWPNQNDQGRFEATKLEADKMRFRVPSLRNVAMTAPYFHDGSGQTLPEAVQTMARYQLGTVLAAAEVQSIVDYLNALTGELPKASIKGPELAARGSHRP